MKDTDQIAQLGEDIFSHMCHKENLVVNSSKNQDQGGWDFIVENKALYEIEDKVFNGARKSSLFQLKATRSIKRKSWQISLSNLLRFAQHTIPCFYCLIILNEENEAHEVYIRLLDNELITKIKMEVAKLRQGNTLDRLHVEKMSFTFRKKDKVNLEQDVPIQKTIDNLIGKDYPKYVREKMDFYESIGMDKNIVINFYSSSDAKEFVYFLLGYKTEVKLENASLIAECFGTIVENLELNGSKLSSQCPKPNSKGTMQLYLKDSPENLKFRVNYYVLPLRELFGKDFNLCRIESKYLDIFYNLSSIDKDRSSPKSAVNSHQSSPLS